MTVQRYRAFGLEIASEIELSVFAPGRSNEVDVEIRLAEQLSDPEDAEAMRFRNWIAHPGLMVLDVPDVARFRLAIRPTPCPMCRARHWLRFSSSVARSQCTQVRSRPRAAQCCWSAHRE